MDVDPAGRDDLAARVELASPAFEIGPDAGDALAVDGDVGLTRRAAAAVDHQRPHG
jgi:hypothetical protein